MNNRKYNKIDLNYEMRQFEYDEMSNPTKSYDEWINKLKMAISKMDKEVYVKEIKEFRVTDEVLAYRRNIKEQRTKKCALKIKLKDNKLTRDKKENLINNLRNINKEINKLKRGLQTEIKVQVEMQIDKEINQLQKGDVRSLKYWRKVSKDINKTQKKRCTIHCRSGWRNF